MIAHEWAWASARGGVMIEQLLPRMVCAVDTRGDAEDAILFPEEERALGRAVDKRRREFTTARVCARAALVQLGLSAGPIPTGERGEPRWPTGVVGSITHCAGYRACAVARSAEVMTIGIDAEPHAPLPDGLLGDIARPEEMSALSTLRRVEAHVHWDRLLFSAKEAIYKAWFPLTRRGLGFEDALLQVDPNAGTFSARVLVPVPEIAAGRLASFSGRWTVCEGLLLTAVTVEAEA